jgi:hypothetical protein
MSFFGIDPSKELGSNDQATEKLFEEKKPSKSSHGIDYRGIFDEPQIEVGETQQAPDFLDEEIEPEGDEEIDELADFDGEEAPQEQGIRRLREELDNLTQVRLDNTWGVATLRATDARRG